MRRLWSHIILAATSLAMVGATFAAVVTNIDSNIEFKEGKEFVFRVSNKGADGNPDDSEPLEESALDEVKNIAAKMEKRLEAVNISSYKVEIQGYDTIKVSFVQDNDEQYNIIKNYLPFNGTLALSNSKGTYALSEEFLNQKEEAYMETSDTGYPTIVIPINKDNEAFKAVYEEAKKMTEDNEGEVEQEEEHDHEEGEEEEEHEHKHVAYLYLWYNYVEDYYSYDKIDQNSPDTYDPNVATKVLMTFEAANPFYDEDEDSLRAYVSPQTEEGTEITPESLGKAYEDANYYVNLLKAGEICNDDYTVSFMLEDKAKVAVESLVSLSEHMNVAWSRTFIATLCAIVVTSLLLIYFYRLGALSVATTSIVSTFFGLFFVTLFGAEFNIAGIIGLIAVALTSIISGIIYLNKLKEECYRGRSLKKANTEAAKKALLPIIDVHVVIIATGVACFLLGGAIMRAFAVCAILGGLVSFILNVFGLRGLLWLVTNEPKLANRYDLFDVNADQVPNALEEEKQKYFGANADKDFTKGKKPVGIVSAILLVGSIAAMIVTGVINKGAVYNPGDLATNSEVYVEYRSETVDNTALSLKTKEVFDTILDNAYLDGSKLSEITDFESYDYVTQYKSTLSGITTVYYAYYRISFDKAYTGEENVIYKVGGNDINYKLNDLFTRDSITETSGVNLVLDNNVNVSFKVSERVNADQPAFTDLIIATSVAAGICFLYFLLRYRLSRGIASLCVGVLSIGISAGLFAILYFLPATSYASVALPLIAIFTFDIATLFMNKEREMVLEDKSRNNSVENRNEIMKKAIAYSSTPIIIAYIIALYLGVNYFGFMYTSVSWVFLLVILGVSIAAALVLCLYGPISQFFFGLFANVQIKKPKVNKKAKARPVRVKKSAEPEEAIFIGIND